MRLLWFMCCLRKETGLSGCYGLHSETPLNNCVTCKRKMGIHVGNVSCNCDITLNCESHDFIRLL